MTLRVLPQTEERVENEEKFRHMAHLRNLGMNRAALVIGNGPSRAGLDLAAFDGITIGCNALHRTFIPDYLVTLDREMCDEIAAGHVHEHTKVVAWHPTFISREPHDNLYRAWPLPDALTASSAGALAYLTAAALNCYPIVLVGFDGLMNPGNVFADSPGYGQPLDQGSANNMEKSLLGYVARCGTPPVMVWPKERPHNYPFRRISWETALGYGKNPRTAHDTLNLW